MEELFIVPIRPVSFKENFSAPESGKVSGSSGAAAFRDIFQGFIDEAKDAEADYAKQQYLLATGQTEDAHNVTIAGSYAQLTVDMLVSLRNKTLESYNELMRLNI